MLAFLASLALSAGTSAPACIAGYSQEAIEYFREVAMRPERGERYSRPRRWAGDLGIEIEGQPKAGEEAEVAGLVAELQPLVRPLNLSVGDSEHSLVVRFVPRARFAEFIPGYVGHDLGLFRFSWDERGVIRNGQVLIADEVTGQARLHILREEITQALGLPGDSRRYPESLFYAGWSIGTEISALDRDVIRLLYDSDVSDEQRVIGQSCSASSR